MYIKSYKCTRFAGLKDIDLEFHKGINVILGPNESGKSTIIEGIHSTLFKDTKLRKNNNPDKEFSFKFMPQPNGDFIDGIVEIENHNGRYKIYKEWGSKGDIYLSTPNESIIKNENKIKEELDKIIIHGDSTYTNIVFAKQRDLKNALYNIIKNNEVTNEINDLLRRSLMELDGISIDNIEQNIENELEDLYKKWDKEKNYPENNKGINNPYKTGLGKILESYYKKEKLKLSMDKADESEKKFENICNNMKVLEDTIELLIEQKIELEKIENDVTNRLILNAEISSINKDLADLAEANRQWPKAEIVIEGLEEKIDWFKKEREKLYKEKNEIEKIRQKEKIEKRLKSIEDLQYQIENIMIKLSNIKNISKEDIEKLAKIKTDLLTLETTMKASKMIGILKKSSNKTVYVSKDFGDKEELELDTIFEANGLISISYGNEFEIEIKTGDLDFKEISNRYKTSKKQYDEFLIELSIDSIEEGKLNLETIKSLNNEKKSLEKQIDIILDNDLVENLKKELKDLKDIKINKNLEKIENELERIHKEELEASAIKKNKSDQIKLWMEKYSNIDNLLELLVDKKTIFNHKTKELEGLKPLPEEFATAEEFKAKLSLIKENLNISQIDLDNLKSDYYEAKNNLLDTSFEELKKEYLDAEDMYFKYINRGEKLIEIQRVFIKTKEKLSKDPLGPLVSEFARLLDIITDGSYQTGEIDEDFNIKLENINGEIPIELLSAGTYDSVALALRFSLLKHIFDGKSGYVILDDCLVDLDPNRKAQSIKLINDFAKDYQVIFTTCDPTTAKMLGGNIINL